MSRTFRRKNYEQTVKNKWGSKAGGYYTYWELIEGHQPGHNHGYERVYCPCTEQEKNQEYWRIHGESKRPAAWSPGWWYCQDEAIKFKTREKAEMRRCLNDLEGYDAVFYADPPSCWLYWRMY